MLTQRCRGFRKERHQTRARGDAARQATTVRLLLFKHDDAALALSVVRLLVYGLSFVSGLSELVVQTLKRSNETCVHPTMEEQFMVLIVIPMQEFAETCPETTVVLVIDGVDECPANTCPTFLVALRAGIPYPAHKRQGLPRHLPDIACQFSNDTFPHAHFTRGRIDTPPFYSPEGEESLESSHSFGISLSYTIDSPHPLCLFLIYLPTPQLEL